MPDKRVRFEYRSGTTDNYVIQNRHGRHHVYDRIPTTFGHRLVLLGETSSFDDAISLLKTIAKSGHKSVNIDDT
jgi:hypothetical protein